ncbi:MAG: PEP-CTERM sorting domain-containing protein [Burkholderiaceae bacterium]
MNKIAIGTVQAALALGLAVPLQAGATSYAITALASFDGTNSGANAINDEGQVVGFTGRGAVVWNGATPTLLAGLYGGDQQGSYATSINDAGRIVGVNGWGAAAAWTGTTQTTLDRPFGAGSNAWGINNAGQAVGMSDPGQAAIWSGAATTVLTPGGGKAYAINDAGEVAGCVCSPDQYDSQAVVWNAGVATVLGGTWGPSNGSAGLAINEAGEVVGYGTFHATMVPVVWNGTTPTILPTLGTTPSKAKAVNDAGQIVGISAGHAALWTGDSVTDLNVYLDAADQAAGWYLLSANDINDLGVIVGTEHNSLTGATRAFELSPVPEPGSLGLAFAGLALIGLVARRKRSRIE